MSRRTVFRTIVRRNHTEAVSTDRIGQIHAVDHRYTQCSLNFYEPDVETGAIDACAASPRLLGSSELVDRFVGHLEALAR